MTNVNELTIDREKLYALKREHEHLSAKATQLERRINTLFTLLFIMPTVFILFAYLGESLTALIVMPNVEYRSGVSEYSIYCLVASIVLIVAWVVSHRYFPDKYRKAGEAQWMSMPEEYQTIIALDLPPFRDEEEGAVKIVRERLRLGLDFRDVAKNIDYSPGHYYLCEKGERPFSEEAVRKLITLGFNL